LFTANTGSTTAIGSREVSTEPATPSSPTPSVETNRRALRRERSERFVHAVLHYSRAEDDLQPWFWCVYSLLSLLERTSYSSDFHMHARIRICQAGQRRGGTSYSVKPSRIPTFTRFQRPLLSVRVGKLGRGSLYGISNFLGGAWAIGR
jgi:hypothetical protein